MGKQTPIEIVRELLSGEYGPNGEELQTARDAFEKVADQLEVLKHNESYYMRQFINALLCEGCSKYRKARLQNAVDNALKGVSQKQRNKWAEELEQEAPLSGDDLMLPEELENQRLRTQLAEVQSDIAYLLQYVPDAVKYSSENHKQVAKIRKRYRI